MTIKVSELVFVTLAKDKIEGILSNDNKPVTTFYAPTSEYVKSVGWVILYEDPSRFIIERREGSYIGGGILAGAVKLEKCKKVKNSDTWQWHMEKVIPFSESKQILSWVVRRNWDIGAISSKSEREDVTKYLLAEMAETGLTE